MLQLICLKGGERFIFRWNRGEEDLLLDALEAQANNLATNFDIYDAAYLSLQLSDYLISQADVLLIV